jgi:hypothetical protein
MKRAVSPAFLPGRNAIFLAVACAEAAGVEAREVWIGVNAVDFSGYPARIARAEAWSLPRLLVEADYVAGGVAEPKEFTTSD